MATGIPAQREGRIAGSNGGGPQGWCLVWRGQAGQGGADTSQGGILGEQKWRMRMGTGRPGTRIPTHSQASPGPGSSRKETLSFRGTQGPAECRRGFQNQRPLAQSLAQLLDAGDPPPKPESWAMLHKCARAWEPKGASRPGAKDVCTVSQCRCGALVTHSSTEAGEQASRPPRPLHPPAKGRPWDGRGRAGCRQRPWSCTARGCGPGPV